MGEERQLDIGIRNKPSNRFVVIDGSGPEPDMTALTIAPDGYPSSHHRVMQWHNANSKDMSLYMSDPLRYYNFADLIEWTTLKKQWERGNGETGE